MELPSMFSSIAWLMPAILACLLSSVASGVIGGYVMARKINNAAGGIAHIVLGGAGIALYFNLPIVLGSLVVAVIGAIAIGLFSNRYPDQEDVIINALWSMSMAMGIILLSLSDQSNIDYAAYLFGNVLLADQHDLQLLLGVNAVVLVTVGLTRRALLSWAFDREFARTRGLPVVWLNYLLLVLVALVVVSVVRVVGIIFVVALITLPPALARLFCATLKNWIKLSIVINLIASALGIGLAYFADLPIGAVVVSLLGLGYLISVLVVKPIVNS